MLVVEDLVVLLQHATSYSTEMIKWAEQRLQKYETDPLIVVYLTQIYANTEITTEIRLASILQLKHVIDKHWKPKDFSLSIEHRNLIKDIFIRTLPDETESTIAVQASIIVSKIVRKDDNGSWPELFNLLRDQLTKKESEQSRYHCAMTLKEVTNMMKSKRLPADRRLFRELAKDIWPIASDLWLYSQRLIAKSSSNLQFRWRLEAARYGLKIMRSLCIYGSENANECPRVQGFIKDIMEELPTILEQYNGCLNSISELELLNFEKLITLHGKILVSLSDEYYVSLNSIQTHILQFSAELVAAGNLKSKQIPSRFRVQLMLILKLFASIASDTSLDEQDPNVTQEHIKARRLASGFYIQQNLTTLARFLITDYLQLTPHDLESWEGNPEEYVSEGKQEVWKYDIRPCSEVLLLSLVHHYQSILVPVLVNMVSEVQNVILPKVVNNENDQSVLIADAVLNAIGLTSYELSGEVDFDSWFVSTLAPLMSCKTSRILKRRVSWLVGQWVGVKFAPDNRPQLYALLVGQLDVSEDLVVRLEAALTLKATIDDYGHDPTQFVEYQEQACSKLFKLLTDCEECDTKMRVLYIYSLILKRQRGLIQISISQLSEYLPVLWSHAEEHHLLRGAIICLLLELTLSITSESVNIYSILLPIINTSCNPHSIYFIYLADDGLDLWLAVLQTAPAVTNDLLHLIEHIPHILQSGSESLKTVFKIIESYLLIDVEQFVSTPYFERICDLLHDGFGEFNEKCLLLVVRFIEFFLLTSKSRNVEQLPNGILKLIKCCLNQMKTETGIVLKSSIYSVIGHAMLYFNELNHEILKNVVPEEFVSDWCKAMDSITHTDRRKIAALLFIELLENNRVNAVIVLSNIIYCLVEILTGIGVNKDASGVSDNLKFTVIEKDKIVAKRKPREPAELWIDLRKQRMQLTNEAYNQNLVQKTISVLSNQNYQQIYEATVDESVRKQLEELLKGDVEVLKSLPS